MAEVTMEEAPRKAREMFDKGFAAMERGNLDYAIDMFMSVLDLEPRLLRARKFLRAAQLKKVGTGSALKHTLSSVKGASGLLKAKGLVAKKPLEALKATEQLLSIDPLNMTFIRMLDQAAMAADLPEIAVQGMEVAKEHHPRDTEILERLGQLYLAVHQPNRARACFEELVALKPNDQKALKALKDSAALDTMQSGGWDSAGSYRDVMKDSKQATILEQQARSVKAATGVEALIEDTLAKIAREPDNVNYRRALADLYSRGKRYDEALQVLQEALAKSGGADPDVDRSIAGVRVAQYDARFSELKAAGQAAEAQALDAEKQEFLFTNAKERVAKYPTDLQFKYDLGVMLYDRGEITEAIQQFQASQQNPQRRTMSLYYLGLCFQAKKQYDIAVTQLELAVADLTRMDDMKKDIVYQLGQLAELMNDTDKAMARYKEIYAVDIGYRDVAEKIEKGYGAS